MTESSAGRRPGRLLLGRLIRPHAVLVPALLALALVGAVGFGSAAVAQDAAPAGDPVVAKVNGVEVRASDLAVVEEELGTSIPPMAPEAKREYLISLLTDTILVAQAAEAKGVDKTPDFQRRLAFTRNRLLSEVLLQQEAKAALTEENLRKVYQEAVASMGNEEEVRARHILFRVEDQSDEKASKAAEEKVRAVIVRLKQGEDFGALAKELTEDPSGKENGGDLGYFTRDQMVPEFSQVAFTLAAGAISDPLKTQFGWHVLKVEDKRNRPVPEFDKVRDQLESYVVRKAQSEFVAKLRAAGKVERMTPPAPKAQ
ncbi:MAG: peptidyl-prolyl cis-trans isomerase [Variibacter sp.]|nr:peptidyl-prolyl cis-trans isomerase [Variibacter sp.]